MGSMITKSNKFSIVMIAGLALGFFISVAEPDLHILASQVESVTGGTITKFSIVVVVSIGIAVLLSIGLGRIVKAFPLYKLLTVLYLVIFVMAIFTSEEFLAISFDASGATTGAMTVPFIMVSGYRCFRDEKRLKVIRERQLRPRCCSFHGSCHFCNGYEHHIRHG